MRVDLSDVIAEYFAADRSGDSDGVSACFAADARVTDEGQTHEGAAAIRRWKAAAAARYTYTAEPFEAAQEGEATVVRAHVRGNFPGSPVDLTYRFRLDGGKIAALEITA